MIQPLRTGVRVPVDDPPALATALQILATDPALRRRLGAAARDRVVTQYSWSTVAAAYAQQLTAIAVPDDTAEP
jgi:glycosyltransferase involved in cell wall biosynthesis